MPLISIGATPETITAMPEPKTYSVPMQDMLGESAYSESGNLIRNRVRQGIRKIDLGWAVGGEDAQTLLSAIQPDKVFVTYYDPHTGGFVTAEMYVDDRSCNLVSYKSETEPETNYWEISFSLTQY